jgi:Domain of Unknown Function (DUF1080)
MRDYNLSVSLIVPSNRLTLSMLRPSMLRFILCVTGLATCLSTVTAQESVSASQDVSEIPSGFTPLFDGKTLEGWHAHPHIAPAELRAMSDEERNKSMQNWMNDAKQHWTIENGELVNDGSGPFLVTNDEFEDYELFLQYKTVAGADSGIYLKDTPQVQIWDVNNLETKSLGSDLGSGALWNNSAGAAGKDPLVLADLPFGQWNTFLIRQVGSRTTVMLNGKLTVDHAILENFWDRKQPLARSGHIQLQTHGGEIRWRNIAVRKLNDQEANQYFQAHHAVDFKPIFDGKSLDGWIGATDNYEVVDGAIRCKPNSGGNLLTENEYENFIARIEFRLPPAGNNGLAIRAPRNVGDPAYSAMCELQVLDTEHPNYANIDPRQAHGSVYGMVAATRGYLRPTGQWNFQEVTVKGSHIRVELNGNVILDTDVSQVTEFMGDKPHPGKDRTKGHLGFAGHGDPVEFRNLSIRTLAVE